MPELIGYNDILKTSVLQNAEVTPVRKSLLVSKLGDGMRERLFKE